MQIVGNFDLGVNVDLYFLVIILSSGESQLKIINFSVPLIDVLKCLSIPISNSRYPFI